MRKSAHLFFGLLLFCCSAIANAQVLVIAARLQAGDYAALESNLDDAQRRFEAGALSEEGLREAFAGFGNARLRSFEAQLQAWVTHSPQSYAAHLALGSFYRSRGWQARGKASADRTSKSQFAAMQHEFDLSAVHLRASLPLTAKPLLSYWELMSLAGSSANRAQLEALLLLANEALPSNTLARIRFAHFLTPRWGGSYEQFDAFIERCRRQGASASLLQQLAAIEHDDRGQVAFQKGDALAAKSEFEQALDLAQKAGDDAPRFIKTHLAHSTRNLCEGKAAANPFSACPVSAP